MDYSSRNEVVVEKGSDTVDSASEVGPWSDPVTVILELVASRLSIADRLSMSRVCKTWFSVVCTMPSYEGLSYGFPCQASIDRDGKTCTLTDPKCNELHIKCQNLPSHCIILYSKGGVAVGVTPFSLWRTTFCLFLQSSDKVCRRGEREWTDLEEEDSYFGMGQGSPVFCNGSFYFLADDGKLGVFDPITEIWSTTPNEASMGQLVSRGWTLFVGRRSSICSKADVLIGNGIYFPRVKDGGFMFYSLEDRKFCPGGNFCRSKAFPLSCWVDPVFDSSYEEQLKWDE